MGWNTWVQHPERAVEPLVREFYANVAVTKGYLVKVRGKKVRYDPATINAYYGLPDVPNCEYNERSVTDEEVMEISIRICGGQPNWSRGAGNKLLHFPRSYLPVEAKVWYYFICFSIFPTGHTSTVDRGRLILLDYMLRELPVNFGRLISSEIQRTARTPALSYWYPCLITDLCVNAAVQWDGDQDTLLKPKTPINNKEINRFFKEGRPPLPPPYVPTPVEVRLERMEQEQRESRRRQRGLDRMLRMLCMASNLDVSGIPAIPDSPPEEQEGGGGAVGEGPSGAAGGAVGVGEGLEHDEGVEEEQEGAAGDAMDEL